MTGLGKLRRGTGSNNQRQLWAVLGGTRARAYTPGGVGDA